MGLWMNQSVRREINGVDYVEGKTSHKALMDHKVGFDELRTLCREAEPFEAYVDVDDDRFLAPDSMIQEIKQACAEGASRSHTPWARSCAPTTAACPARMPRPSRACVSFRATTTRASTSWVAAARITTSTR